MDKGELENLLREIANGITLYETFASSSDLCQRDDFPEILAMWLGKFWPQHEKASAILGRVRSSLARRDANGSPAIVIFEEFRAASYAELILEIHSSLDGRLRMFVGMVERGKKAGKPTPRSTWSKVWEGVSADIKRRLPEWPEAEIVAEMAQEIRNIADNADGKNFPKVFTAGGTGIEDKLLQVELDCERNGGNLRHARAAFLKTYKLKLGTTKDKQKSEWERISRATRRKRADARMTT